MERSSSFPFRYFAVKAVWTGGNDIDFYHVADPGTLRLHMDGLKPWRFADKLPSVATGAFQQQRHGFSDGGLVEFILMLIHERLETLETFVHDWRGNLFGHIRGRCAWTGRSEEHTAELQSLMRSAYAVCCLKKKSNTQYTRVVCLYPTSGAAGKH